MNKKIITHIHQQFSRLLIAASLASLLLGHLSHYQLNSWLSFYAHDILMVFFLLLNFNSLLIFTGRLLRKWCFSKQRQNLQFGLIIVSLLIVMLGWVFSSGEVLLLACLYTSRLLIYALFIFLFQQKNFFSQQEQQQLLLFFLLAFLLFSWGQYLFFPDLRALGYLGYDDHQARLIGLWLDPAFTGLVLLYTSIYLLKVNFTKQYWRLILLVLSVGGLLLTFSRAVYLASLIVIVFALKKHSAYRAKIFTPSKIIFFTIGLLIGALLLSNFAKIRPANSLWRSHSVIIRLQSAKAQLASLTFKDYLLGRGLFVPSKAYGERLVAPQTVQPVANAPIVKRKTANFSDNFFILLISFFGLPLTIIYLIKLLAILKKYYYQRWLLFLMMMATLVVAQFNQTVFQPLIFILINWFYWSTDFAAIADDKLNK